MARVSWTPEMSEFPPTLRLYFADAYRRAFTAPISALTTWHDRPAAVLEATAFYPEGGGQPADRGTLEGIAVLDVQEEDEVIYHLLAQPLAAGPGTTITGEIDWVRRHDHMQQHTGQHTLSGAFWRLFGAETKSWHLGADEVTIDLGRTGLSDDDLRAAEHAANEVLWDDVPVVASFYDAEELVTLELRKGTERAGRVRVVSVGAWDRIGCGGTHVATSGQVGAIGLRRAETRGEMTRVAFVCGARALADYRAKTSMQNMLVARLKAPPGELEAQIDRLQAQLAEAHHEAEGLRGTLLDYEARDLLSATPDRIAAMPLICARLDGRDPAALRQLAQRLAVGGGTALLGSSAGDKVQLVFACPPGTPCDMNLILKAALPLIGGRGGGQKTLAQGGGPDVTGLDAALAAARQACAATNR